MTPETAHVQPAAGRVGPNAIIQLLDVLDRRVGPMLREDVTQQCGGAWSNLEALVPEREAARLHDAVRQLPCAATLLDEAGRQTADYIIAHRIPRLIVRLLPRLPGFLGRRLLGQAIARHSWTFAGSGEFQVTNNRPLTFELRRNPLAPDAALAQTCQWHCAVFTRMFQRLVDPRLSAVETSCAARGGDCCRFVILNRPAQTPAGACRRRSDQRCARCSTFDSRQ